PLSADSEWERLPLGEPLTSRLWRAGRPPPGKSSAGQRRAPPGRATVPDVPTEPNGPAPDLDPLCAVGILSPRASPRRAELRGSRKQAEEAHHETSDCAGLRRPDAAGDVG